MHWNRIRQASLKVRLLVLLLPVMALVTVGSLWLTRSDSVAAANAAYDRSLLGAIKALDLNVSTVSGGLAVELPYRLFEFFQLTATGSVYFRVATADGLVEIGNPDLPTPPRPLLPGQPQFYDALYFGESVRVGAFMRPLAQAVESSESDFVVIQVAESTASREQFTASFLRPQRRGHAAPARARPAPRCAPAGRRHQPAAATHRNADGRATLLCGRRLAPAAHTAERAARPAGLHLARGRPSAKSPRPACPVGRTGPRHPRHQPAAGPGRSDTGVAQQAPFDLAALVREVALELMPLARERGVDFGVDAPEYGLPCVGDRALLRQALLNLAHNAIQHGRPQGTATLGAAADTLGYRVQVTDDGDGMDDEVRKHAGQRFVKGRHSPGSGLGMAIARSVIEAHGGSLRVEPLDPGPGLCVALWWPR